MKNKLYKLLNEFLELIDFNIKTRVHGWISNADSSDKSPLTYRSMKIYGVNANSRTEKILVDIFFVNISDNL